MQDSRFYIKRTRVRIPAEVIQKMLKKGDTLNVTCINVSESFAAHLVKSVSFEVGLVGDMCLQPFSFYKRFDVACDRSVS